MRLAITGATGYIGARLATLAQQQGYIVVAASRCPPDNAAISWIRYELASDSSVELPEATDAVIHLAANTAPNLDMNGEDEVRAACVLIAAARQSNAKLIFVSSQTARPDAPTEYGRTKWRIEQEVLAAGGWVVRPGQVYGGCERALFGTLAGAVRRLPILPAFLPSPKVQPIHVDDLAKGLLRIVELKVPAGVLCLASPEPVSFTFFLSSIARNRIRRRRWFVPLPVAIVKLTGIVIGKRLSSLIGLDRLHSLFDLPVMATENDLKRLDLSLRTLDAGMHPSGNGTRRGLLREGRALLSYLLRERPEASLLRRYVRAIEQLRGGAPLALPDLFLDQPFALSLLTRSVLGSKGEEFAWRLDAATVLAEATPIGARRYLGVNQRSGALVSLLWMAKVVVAETLWRILRLALYQILKQSLHRRTASQ